MKTGKHQKKREMKERLRKISKTAHTKALLTNGDAEKSHADIHRRIKEDFSVKSVEDSIGKVRYMTTENC